MRTVSSASQTEILKTVTQPGYLVEIQCQSGLLRWSSFGDCTWNSVPWQGANMQIDGLSGDGKSARISVWDATAGFRTALLTNGGARNRTIKIWQAQFPALAAGDPNLIFQGVGDGAQITKGKVIISCARLNVGVLLAPRLRITPAAGFNFLAAPGAKIRWGDVTITLGAKH